MMQITNDKGTFSIESSNIEELHEFILSNLSPDNQYTIQQSNLLKPQVELPIPSDSMLPKKTSDVSYQFGKVNQGLHMYVVAESKDTTIEMAELNSIEAFDNNQNKIQITPKRCLNSLSVIFNNPAVNRTPTDNKQALNDFFCTEMDRLVERFSLLIASSQYSPDPNDKKIQSSVTITFAHSKAFKPFLEDYVRAFSESPAPADLTRKSLPQTFHMTPPVPKFHINGKITSYSAHHSPELLNSLVLSTDMALMNLHNYASVFQTPIPNTGKLGNAGDLKAPSSIWSQDNLFCLPITPIFITLPEKQICLTPIKPITY